MEKILEKSGKSQGILSVRKSGNPDRLHATFACSWKKTRDIIRKLQPITGMYNEYLIIHIRDGMS